MSQHDDIVLAIAQCIEVCDAHRAPRGESLVRTTIDDISVFL